MAISVLAFSGSLAFAVNVLWRLTVRTCGRLTVSTIMAAVKLHCPLCIDYGQRLRLLGPRVWQRSAVLSSALAGAASFSLYGLPPSVAL